MTKLEAWKAWCTTAGTERLADRFTPENSSHGKAFSFAWDAAHEECAKAVDAAKSNDQDWDTNDWNQAVESCASRIRARGQS